MTGADGLAMAHIYAAIDRVADTMTTRLRNHARDSGWPEDVVTGLSVVSVGGMLQADIAKEREEAAEHLEYGGPGGAPRPAIWTFFENHRLDREAREAVELASDELAEHYAKVVLY